LLEKSFGRADSLVKKAFEIDFNDVTSQCSDVGTGICWMDDYALKLSFDLAHIDFLAGYFLSN
jgi:hypothetical protein